MKKNYYLILCIYFFSCAVQGPISGGPIDKSPPNLLYTTPDNFSTSISNKEKIILYFDELLDPISVYKSIVINNQDFKIRTKGEKVIISPSNEWDKNACITFRHNFDHKLIEKDIWDLDLTKLRKIDILTAGFQ